MNKINWKLEAQIQAADAGELKIVLAERLEAVRTQITVVRQHLLTEDNDLDQVMIGWKIEQLVDQVEWLESVLCGKAGTCDG